MQCPLPSTISGKDGDGDVNLATTLSPSSCDNDDDDDTNNINDDRQAQSKQGGSHCGNNNSRGSATMVATETARGGVGLPVGVAIARKRRSFASLNRMTMISSPLDDNHNDGSFIHNLTTTQRVSPPPPQDDDKDKEDTMDGGNTTLRRRRRRRPRHHDQSLIGNDQTQTRNHRESSISSSSSSLSSLSGRNDRHEGTKKKKKKVKPISSILMAKSRRSHPSSHQTTKRRTEKKRHKKPVSSWQVFVAASLLYAACVWLPWALALVLVVVVDEWESCPQRSFSYVVCGLSFFFVSFPKRLGSWIVSSWTPRLMSSSSSLSTSSWSTTRTVTAMRTITTMDGMDASVFLLQLLWNATTAVLPTTDRIPMGFPSGSPTTLMTNGLIWSPDTDHWRTDARVVVLLSFSLALIRLVITQCLVPLKEEQAVQALVECKSVHLLSQDYPLTPQVSTKKLIVPLPILKTTGITKTTVVDNKNDIDNTLAESNDNGDEEDAILPVLPLSGDEEKDAKKIHYQTTSDEMSLLPSLGPGLGGVTTRNDLLPPPPPPPNDDDDDSDDDLQEKRRGQRESQKGCPTVQGNGRPVVVDSRLVLRAENHCQQEQQLQAPTANTTTAITPSTLAAPVRLLSASRSLSSSMMPSTERLQKDEILGLEQQRQEEQERQRRLYAAPRLATAVFRFLYSVTAVILAWILFRSTPFWPWYVGGRGTTQACWDLSGTLVLMEDSSMSQGPPLSTTISNAVNWLWFSWFSPITTTTTSPTTTTVTSSLQSLKRYFLWQASYHCHAFVFHILTSLWLWAWGRQQQHQQEQHDASQHRPAFFWSTAVRFSISSFLQHALALLLIGMAYIFSSIRRLGAVGMFAFDASSVFLHLLQVAMNYAPLPPAPVTETKQTNTTPPLPSQRQRLECTTRSHETSTTTTTVTSSMEQEQQKRRQRTLCRGIFYFGVLPSFVLGRFVIWPALWWSSWTTASAKWFQQLEQTLFWGASWALQCLWNTSLLAVLLFNIWHFRRLVGGTHPHLQRILRSYNNEKNNNNKH